MDDRTRRHALSEDAFRRSSCSLDSCGCFAAAHDKCTSRSRRSRRSGDRSKPALPDHQPARSRFPRASASLINPPRAATDDDVRFVNRRRRLAILPLRPRTRSSQCCSWRCDSMSGQDRGVSKRRSERRAAVSARIVRPLLRPGNSEQSSSQMPRTSWTECVRDEADFRGLRPEHHRTLPADAVDRRVRHRLGLTIQGSAHGARELAACTTSRYVRIKSVGEYSSPGTADSKSERCRAGLASWTQSLAGNSIAGSWSARSRK